MTHSFRPAKRNKVQLLIGTAGATGSGKTFSLLLLAQGLAYPEAANADDLNRIIEAEGKSRICFIDTERGRALHYAPPPNEKPDPWRTNGAWFAFDHANLEAPYTPSAYQSMIEAADDAGYAVIVVDSFSHEWVGEGGILEMQEVEFERLGRRDAVKMTSWIKPKMAHKKLVGRLTALHAHLLVGLRAEEKVRMVPDPEKPGKTKIIAAADLPPAERWSPVCEKAFPFELTLSFVLSPTAPGVPVPVKLQDQHRAFVPLDQPLSIETGRRLAEWAAGAKAGAEPVAKTTPPKVTPEQYVETYVAGLADVHSVDELTDYQAAATNALGKLRKDYPDLHRRCVEANGQRYAELTTETTETEEA